MVVNKAHLAITPMQHQVSNFLSGALNPMPTAMLAGAPTVIVPIKPSPMIPYLSQIRWASPFCDFSVLGVFFLTNIFLILSPKNALTKTPARPPVTLAKNMVQ